MGRRLVRIGEAIRRALGKPGRRSGIDRRKGLEMTTKSNFVYHGSNPQLPNKPRAKLSLYGQDIRSGKDRRKK